MEHIEQTTSLWERLKLCYRALTRDYYIFFACDKDAIQFDENGKYDTTDRNKTSSFTYVGDEPMMTAYGKVTTFHDFYWSIIEKFSKNAQQGEF